MRPTRGFGLKTTPGGKSLKECAFTYLLTNCEKKNFKHFEVEDRGAKWEIDLHHEGSPELPGTRIEHGVIVYRAIRGFGDSKGNWMFIVLCKDRSEEAKKLYGFKGSQSPSVFEYKDRNEYNPYAGFLSELFVMVLNKKVSKNNTIVFEQPIDELLERNGG